MQVGGTNKQRDRVYRHCHVAVKPVQIPHQMQMGRKKGTMGLAGGGHGTMGDAGVGVGGCPGRGLGWGWGLKSVPVPVCTKVNCMWGKL